MKPRQWKIFCSIIASLLICGLLGNRLVAEFKKPMHNLNIQQYLSNTIQSQKLEKESDLIKIEKKLNENILENMRYQIAEILSVQRVGSDLDIKIRTEENVVQRYRYKISQQFVAYIRDE